MASPIWLPPGRIARPFDTISHAHGINIAGAGITSIGILKYADQNTGTVFGACNPVIGRAAKSAGIGLHIIFLSENSDPFSWTINLHKNESVTPATSVTFNNFQRLSVRNKRAADWDGTVYFDPADSYHLSITSISPGVDTVIGIINVNFDVLSTQPQNKLEG